MIVTGSGGERFMMCLGSSLLPRAFDEGGSEFTTRGRELHAYLQRISEGMTAADSLDQVEERFRDACTAVDLDELRDALGLTAELSIAYNPAFDTARVLGVGLEREYTAAGCTEDEIPMTLDVAGLNGDPPTVGKIVDYKSGWSKRTPTDRNWQMRAGALALARVYDLDEVHAQLIHLRDNRPAWRDRATFTAADLAVISAQLRARWEVVLRARDRYAADRLPPDVTQGSWCGYCPSYHACGAKVALVRAAVAGDELPELAREPIAADKIAQTYKRLRELKEPLKRVEAMIYAAAHERPVLLETLDDGTEVWLGLHVVVGNDKLDPEKTRDVVRELLGPDAVDEVSSYEVTKGRLEAACKKRVARGFGAAKMRAVLDELKKRNGIVKPQKHEVTVYKITPQQRAQLAAPAPASKVG